MYIHLPLLLQGIKQPLVFYYWPADLRPVAEKQEEAEEEEVEVADEQGEQEEPEEPEVNVICGIC